MSMYGLAELHMLTDKSTDFADTWSMLDRRIDDAFVLQDLLGLRRR